MCFRERKNVQIRTTQANESQLRIISLLTAKHQYAYSSYCTLYISLAADKENLFNNQELL